MKPIVTKGTNSIYGGDGFNKLPCEVFVAEFGDEEVTCVQTVWELSEEDIMNLSKSKKIYIATMGERPSPMMVGLETFTEDIEDNSKLQ